MYVCLCRAVTEDEVRNVVAEGARDAEQVAQRCGAGTGCGGCRNALRDLMASCGIVIDACPLGREERTWSDAAAQAIDAVQAINMEGEPGK